MREQTQLLGPFLVSHLRHFNVKKEYGQEQCVHASLCNTLFVMHSCKRHVYEELSLLGYFVT
jgi:hypothetical protein